MFRIIAWFAPVGCIAALAIYLAATPRFDLEAATDFCATQPDELRKHCINSAMSRPGALPIDVFVSRSR